MKFKILSASIPALAVAMIFGMTSAQAGDAQTRNHAETAAKTPSQAAQTSTQGNAQAMAQAAPLRVEDVETLLDKPAAYANKRVTVSGEIEKQVDKNTFVLESGGIINDEITVVFGKNLTPAQKALFREDADVMVTGTVRRVGRVEIERELGWDFDPQVKAELERVDTYLIADDVTVKRAE